MDKSFLKLGILDSMIYFSFENDGLEENNISYFQLMVHYNATIESGLLGLDCITSWSDNHQLRFENHFDRKTFFFQNFHQKSAHFQQLCIDFIDINFYYGTEAQITFTLLMVNIETLIY